MNYSRRAVGLITAAVLTSSLGGGTIAAGADGPEAETAGARAPVAFTGKLGCGGGSALGGFTLPVLEMSDKRLDGNVQHHLNRRFVDIEAASEHREVASGTWRITNDAGAWEGSFFTIQNGDDIWSPTVYPLYGEGDYEGLVALHQHVYGGDDGTACEWNIRGVIIDGELPRTPVPVAR